MFRDQFSRLGSRLLRTLGLLAMVLMLSLLATNRAQAQNPVIDWDAIASTTIVTNAHEPPAVAAVWFAYVHLAVYDAVNSIDRQHQPYLFTTDSPVGASEDAAAIAAVSRWKIENASSTASGRGEITRAKERGSVLRSSGKSCGRMAAA